MSVSQNFITFDNYVSKGVNNDILWGKTYKIVNYIDEVKVIVDIGANIGASCLYFSQNYPNADIIAFEPASEPYNLLTKNVEPYSNIRIYNFGLYSTNKTAILHKGNVDSVTSSIGNCTDCCSGGTEQVTLKEIIAVFKEIGISNIDILKIDTEGCEIQLLKSLQNSLLSDVKVLYLEYHSENDRKMIDKIMENSHILHSCSSKRPHRGDLCYIKKSICESVDYYNNYQIVIQ